MAKQHYEEDRVICPHCDTEALDISNGGDPGPWWNGEDDSFDLNCFYCDKPFILETCWAPTFTTYIKNKNE